MANISSHMILTSFLCLAAISTMVPAYLTYDAARSRHTRSVETRAQFESRRPDVTVFSEKSNDPRPLDLKGRLLSSHLKDAALIEAQSIVRQLTQKFSVKLASIQTNAEPDIEYPGYFGISVTISAVGTEDDTLSLIEAIDQYRPSIRVDSLTLQKISRSSDDKNRVTLASRMTMYAKARGNTQ